jgi:hypothetical protein
MGRFALSFIDHGNEGAAMGVNIVDLNAGNFAAQDAAMDALASAVAAVTRGTLVKDTRVAVETVTPGTPPASAEAQRETKWLVRATDDVTGFAVTFTIPTADLTNLVPNTGAMDLVGANGAALVAAIEAVVTSRLGNAISVVEILHVGRNI